MESNVTIKRSKRARRMSLRISSVDRGVTLTIPKYISNKSAQEFISEKRRWIEKHLNNIPERIAVSDATHLPFQGQEFLVDEGETKSVKICCDSSRIYVPSHRKKRNSSLLAFYRLAARDRLVAASDAYADKLGVSYSKISLRDTRSRWGSCTAAGGLMYSWRLILAPPEVLDYVAAHEVAHLVHMHHGPDFWDVVSNVCPNMETKRRWLKTNGVSLHLWDFSN